MKEPSSYLAIQTIAYSAIQTRVQYKSQPLIYALRCEVYDTVWHTLYTVQSVCTIFRFPPKSLA